jgi:hypothetical protein
MAIRVERTDFKSGKHLVTFWYAPDIGIVKMKADDWMQELKSVTMGE